MLKLKTAASAAWLDLPHGVRVKAPPLSVSALRQAEYLAARAHADLKSERGYPDDKDLTDAQTAELEGAYAEARVRALASRITEWEGLADDAGVALPLSAEAIEAFAAHPLVGPAFLRAYEAQALDLVSEGNASAGGFPGNSPAAPATAPAASVAAEPAPAS